MNVIQTIKNFNAARETERLAIKYQHMRADPFGFLRGSCHLFYDRLPTSPALDKAPAAWVCGDLHLENFGSYKGDNRLVYFDLNDFDEAALAPCTWDIVRGLTSTLVGAHTLAIKRDEALEMANAFLAGYADALKQGKARWLERDTADGMIKQLLDTPKSRTRAQFLDTRTSKKNKQRSIRLDGKKALPVTEKQQLKVHHFMAEFASQQPNTDFFKVLDVARRIAGTGSLGVERYIILVEGKGSPNENYLLDLKQAVPSSLSPHLSLKQPHWHSEAHRVVAIQQRMQAVSMAFLQPALIGKKSFVLRGLQPSEDRVQFKASLDPQSMNRVLQSMGELSAWAQLRSSGRDRAANGDELMIFAQRTKWQQQLMDVAEHCSQQTQSDWHLFCEAYDDGELSPS